MSHLSVSYLIFTCVVLIVSYLFIMFCCHFHSFYFWLGPRPITYFGLIPSMPQGPSILFRPNMSLFLFLAQILYDSPACHPTACRAPHLHENHASHPFSLSTCIVLAQLSLTCTDKPIYRPPTATNGHPISPNSACKTSHFTSTILSPFNVVGTNTKR